MRYRLARTCVMSGAEIDFGRRQVLHASLGVVVATYPFTDEDHERSRTVREVLDTYLPAKDWLPATPAAEPDPTESIVLTSNEIVNTWRAGGHAVTQRRTATALADAPIELAIIEPSLTFERDQGIRRDAATALAALSRRPPARQVPRGPITRPAPYAAVSPWPYVVGAAVLGATLATAWMVLR